MSTKTILNANSVDLLSSENKSCIICCSGSPNPRKEKVKEKDNIEFEGQDSLKDLIKDIDNINKQIDNSPVKYLQKLLEEEKEYVLKLERENQLRRERLKSLDINGYSEREITIIQEKANNIKNYILQKRANIESERTVVGGLESHLSRKISDDNIDLENKQKMIKSMEESMKSEVNSLCTINTLLHDLEVAKVRLHSILDKKRELIDVRKSVPTSNSFLSSLKESIEGIRTINDRKRHDILINSKLNEMKQENITNLLNEVAVFEKNILLDEERITNMEETVNSIRSRHPEYYQEEGITTDRESFPVIDSLHELLFDEVIDNYNEKSDEKIKIAINNIGKEPSKKYSHTNKNYNEFELNKIGKNETLEGTEMKTSLHLEQNNISKLCKETRRRIREKIMRRKIFNGSQGDRILLSLSPEDMRQELARAVFG